MNDAANSTDDVDNVVEEIACNTAELIESGIIDTNLTGTELINNIVSAQWDDETRKLIRVKDLSSSIPVWRQGIARKKNTERQHRTTQHDGGYSGNYSIPGASDSYTEHSYCDGNEAHANAVKDLYIHLQKPKLCDNLIRMAMKRVGQSSDTNNSERGGGSRLTFEVNERLRAIVGAFAICKRERRFKKQDGDGNGDDELPKQNDIKRIATYFERERMDLPENTAETLCRVYHDAGSVEEAIGFIEGLGDPDFVTAYEYYRNESLADESDNVSGSGDDFSHGVSESESESGDKFLDGGDLSLKIEFDEGLLEDIKKTCDEEEVDCD